MQKDFEIEICGRNEHYSMPKSHFHNFYELYYLVSGDISYFIEDNVYTVKKGDVVLLPPKSLHKTHTAHAVKNPAHKRILIYFKKEFVKEFLCHNPSLLDFFANRIISVPVQKQQRIEQLLLSLSNEYQNKADTVMLKSLMGELLTILGRYSQKDEGFDIINTEKNDKILNIVRYINSDYSADISLDLLSKKFYMCPSYLSRSFKKVTGFTYIEYLNKVRIKHSADLLLNTTKNVTDVALSSGFSSVNHFCKIFKSTFGVSPLYYRKNF